MRNKRGREIRRWICLILTCAILGNSTGLQYVQAEENESGTAQTTGWDGITREQIWQTEHCEVRYQLMDNWADGYTTMVTMTNTSPEPLENWHVSFSMTDELKDLWNAQQIETDNGITVFKNLGWNQDIEVNQSVNFGFTASGTFRGFPEICELPAGLQTVSDEEYNIAYAVTDEWEGGFTGSILITNCSGRTIEDWQLSFELPYEISDIWEGQIASKDSNRYIIKNKTYNQNIVADGTICIGFTVQEGSAETRPEAFVLEEVTLGAYDGAGDGGNSDEDTTPDTDVSGGDVSSGDIGTGDVSSGDLGGIEITIDTTPFDENEAAGYYLTEDNVESISGALNGAEHVENLEIAITDINGQLIDSGEIAVKAQWTVEDVGLVLGYNNITVTAIIGEEQKQTSIMLMNFNADNMKRADVDLSDTDGDGIDNYTESVFGTDPLSDDTDGDGLKDWDEITKTGTSPLVVDSDEDGAWDGQEDPDEDGLNNLLELQEGTGAMYPDTDGDSLTDGEEVLQYLTNPLEEDTDKDGLRDGEDVKMQFDPLNPDTDGDGILDGDEVLYQTCVEVLDQERVAGVTQVSVSMDCAGCIDNEVSIFNVYNLDMRSTDVVGLIGAPVDIETEESFEEATITFTYDEAALGETSEDNLRIMWYDEENDKYIILDDETVIDTENNTLSYTTDHFSTWMIVDRKKWWDSWKIDLGYTISAQNKDWFYNIAHVIEDGEDSAKWDCEKKYTAFSGTWTITYRPNELGQWGAGGSFSCSGEADTIEEAIDIAFDKIIKRQSKGERLLCIVTDNDILYDRQLVQKAKTYGIKINVMSRTGVAQPNLYKMASETGGKSYKVRQWNSDGVYNAISDEKKIEYGSTGVLSIDSDEDGLLDTYETKGMRLSNSKIVKTDAFLTDSDGDNINDFIAMGGLPKEETFMVDGEEFTAVVNRGSINTELSGDFIYVDGRENKNGMIIDSKMDYVPYLDGKNKKPWYVDDGKENRVFKGESRNYGGLDELHGLFAHRIDEVSFAEWKVKYESWNVLAVHTLIKLHAYTALDCFATFVAGVGGSEPGIDGMGSRKYVNSYTMLSNVLGNDARKHYKENMSSAITAAKSVLNEYNTEVYIAVAPEANWSGCTYADDFYPRDIYQMLTNIDAFGAFNKADAVATIHCTYDPNTNRYFAEYKYYLTDYYNFDIADTFEEQNMLGIAKSYELYGESAGFATIDGDKGLCFQIPDIF